MSSEERPQQFRPQLAGADEVSNDEIDAQASPRGTARSLPEAKPAWLEQFVWSLLWKFVAV